MKRDVEITTADGTAQAAIFRPSGGAGRAGVLFYMDAFGPRPALDAMAERLAGQGYAVLLPDIFYRDAPYGPFDAKTAFAEEKTRAKLTGLISGTTQEMTVRDGQAFIELLSREGIDRIGVRGCCMWGSPDLDA